MRPRPHQAAEVADGSCIPAALGVDLTIGALTLRTADETIDELAAVAEATPAVAPMPQMRRPAIGVRSRAAALCCAAALATAALAACGSDEEPSSLDPAAHPIALPGAMRSIDFDDIVYSPELERVIVPARESGLYLIEPASGHAERLGHVGSADSADAGDDSVFVLDREQRILNVLERASGRTVASVDLKDGGDYVRYVRPTHELWITQPAASPSGIEILALPSGGGATPRHAAFVAVPDGPEGLVWSAGTGKAYTHAGSDVVTIDLESHAVTDRWATGCEGTHGFPRVDERDGVLLASCSADGKVVLLDLDDGRQLDDYAVGDGEALPGYSERSDHFYVRADPGTRLATLAASPQRLRLVRRVEVPDVGHCLTADTVGHYWTCDAEAGRVLRFDDP